MGWIRGNPRALLLVFFAIATFLTGGLYSVPDWTSVAGNPVAAFSVGAVFAALAFVLLVLGRIFWLLMARDAGRCRPEAALGRDP